ncbi:hypothetical protein F443_12157 [Phytophthora nicotianae P1569]|uniref:Uncharacterized protein n=1 Tax=Phytophthora nicotianae P1569 TaxID=1317065 RepID=V9EU16_PHYNI|nr:hypothetical protein F443_12157 [Phytophthora nicotianae P1569]
MTTARSVTAVSSGTRPSAERRKRSSKQLNDVEVSDSVENAQQTEHQTASVTEGEMKGNEDMAVLINDMTPSTNVSRQLLTEVDSDRSRIERGDAERDVVVEGQQEPASTQTPVASSSTADTNVTVTASSELKVMVTALQQLTAMVARLQPPPESRERVQYEGRDDELAAVGERAGDSQAEEPQERGADDQQDAWSDENDDHEEERRIRNEGGHHRNRHGREDGGHPDARRERLPTRILVMRMDTGTVVVDMTRAAITAAAPAKNHMIDVMDVVGMSNANNVDGVNTMDIEDTVIMGIGVNDSQRRRV